MTPEAWQRVRDVLDQALQVSPGKRAEYLDQACAGETELRAEVESLVEAHERAGTTFLEGEAIQAAGFEGSAGNAALEGQRIGPYRVVEEIGHGGMGVVYRAVRADDQFRKEVAIKVVRGGLGDEWGFQRFRAERQILANLDHPNIARLLDGGAVDGRPYVVMEYVQGKPIDEYCDVRKLGLRERLELFRTVCSAVAYAHQHLVIHRDIKPGNVLVTEDGQPKLLDFGIAKILDPELHGTGDPTMTMMRLMTPEYASPEQTRGEAITTASDVYSLGVMLYGLLTGRRPYRITGKLPHEMARAVLENEPERPSTSILRPGDTDAELLSAARGSNPEKLKRRLEGDLDNIILKALRKEPERRYVSVEQFSDDIGRYLAGLPVIARPDTFSYRSGKFVRRHKAAVMGAAVAVLALLGGIGATLRQAAIARAERERAEQRFYDVRQLANSLLFEVHDAIQNLPGSTPARKILVDRALQYLDKLAKEAKGDLSLQRELAAAYEKVGDVQGGFRAANLGDTAGFISSYRKALEIRQAVYETQPSNEETQRELIRTHGRLSDGLTATGDQAGSVEQLRQLLPIAERLVAENPRNLRDRRNLAAARLDYGSKTSGSGNWRTGLEECRKAVAMLEDLAAADPKDRNTRRILAVAYERTGDLESTYARQHRESLEMHQKALRVEQELLAEDPHNADLAMLQAWDTMKAGEETAALGDAAASQRAYHDALGKFQALSKADPKNAQFHYDVAEALAHIGTAHLDAGQAGAAIEQLEAALAEMEPLKTDGWNTDQLELVALTQYRVGKAYDQRASARSTPGQNAEDWRQAAAWYDRSIPNLEEAAKRGMLQGDDAQVLENARSALKRCRGELAKLANRP